MRNRFLIVAITSLVLTGCPAEGFFGRYVVVNNTGCPVSNLRISVDAGTGKTWDETLPGQGWIHSQSLGRKFLIVSWSDETGIHKEQFSFDKKTGYRSYADLYVELKPNGDLAWRVVEPPTSDGVPSTTAALVVAFVYYCLGASLLIGVPVALAGIISWGLFKASRIGLIGIVEMLRGEHSVFQFSIREIMLLTTAIALALGWFVHFSAWMSK